MPKLMTLTAIILAMSTPCSGTVYVEDFSDDQGNPAFDPLFNHTISGITGDPFWNFRANPPGSSDIELALYPAIDTITFNLPTHVYVEYASVYLSSSEPSATVRFIGTLDTLVYTRGFPFQGVLDTQGADIGEITSIELRSFEGFYDDLTITTAPSLFGDLNGDGFMGITDLNIVLSHWNQNVTPGDFLQGDPSGDGYVAIDDLNFVLGNWNAGTPPNSLNANAVPEPVSIIMLGGVALTMITRRR